MLLGSACRTESSPCENAPGLLDANAARFLPPGVACGTLMPSFALEEPVRATRPVPSGWGPRPEFSREGASYVAHLTTGPGTDLYGTGEIAGPLRRNGKRTQAWTEMPNPSSGQGGFRWDDTYDHLYQAHPWVIGVNADGTAFGVFADTSARTWIDLTDGIRFEASTPFPVIVLKGEAPADVLRQLAELTGHLDMPPRWALGHHQSRFSYVDEAEMRGIAADLRAHSIPTDALWFDGAYMKDYRHFAFDPAHYPDPVGLISDLHTMGYHVVPIVDPGIRADPSFPLYQDAHDQRLFLESYPGTEYTGLVWGGSEFAFPDFSRLETRAWWSLHMSQFVQTYGFDGVWDDMNEPVVLEVVAWYPEESTMALGDDRHTGGTHDVFHNVYALQELDATEAALRAAHPDRRPFVLTRSNFLGGHRHAATWTGDNTASWDHLRWSIAMIANLGLSGQPFAGADIGGFMVPAGTEGTPDPWDPELFAHWIGIGVFYPFCRNHSAGLDDPSTRILGGGPTHHAWDFGPEIERTYREAVERRYRLMPYLYTQFREAARTGVPVLRPLFMAAPAVTRLRAEDRAFLFGPDLLIVPQWPAGVLDDASAIELPDDFPYEITLVGERPDLDAAHPRVHIRSGAIVPTGVVAQTTSYDPSSTLDLYLALDANGTATGTLYEDAGEGHAYLEGDYREIALRAETISGRVVITLERQSGSLELPTRTVRAYLYGPTGVRTATGTTNRIEFPVP